MIRDFDMKIALLGYGRMANMRKYKTWSNFLFDSVVVLLLLIFGLSCLIPILHVVALSLRRRPVRPGLSAGKLTLPL